MPQKVPLEKLCWQWAESTEPGDVTLDNVRTAYRLNLPTCKLGVCRRQCKGNPYCINGIGERVWFSEIEDTSWHDIQDPEEERRKPDTFVGLKNLGATCYVNTFLQLWFHNDTIKQGICSWRDPGVDTDHSQDWHPDSVCAHLQVIFGLLEYSKRRYIDPRDFIQHLGLDAGQQQDAQEFSKLFLSVLEENMKQGQNSNAHNVIKEQFCGSYAYVTRCSNCNTASECPSEFYELDLTIQGHKTLQEALKAFLEVEKLEGDNKYMCTRCGCKQNATRAIELKKLPPVLNLQLLRFVFEIKTGSKKKLNSCIQFPEVLDMSPYLSGNEKAVYDLQAVLIHRGPSAYSGHYVAHIKSKDSQAWYKFNDEEIERIKGKNLQLGSEDNLESKQKKTRTPKGFHASKNAYMLVYTKRTSDQNPEMKMDKTVEEKLDNINNEANASWSVDDTKDVRKSVSAPICSESVSCSEALKVSRSEGTVECFEMKQEVTPVIASLDVNLNAADDITMLNDVCPSAMSDPVSLPPYVMEFVEKDNVTFENWVKEMNDMKSKNIANGRERQETVKSIYQDLVYQPSETNTEGFEWLPLQWLTKWLEDPNSVSPIDITKFICIHGKIDPELSAKMKCVSQIGSEQLFNIYGGNLRLQGLVSLCEACVKARCTVIRTKQRITEDDKYISSVVKKNVDEPLFWIGKASFRSWRRLALERISDKKEGKDNESKDSDVRNGFSGPSDESSNDQKTSSADEESSEKVLKASASEMNVKSKDRGTPKVIRGIKSETDILNKTGEGEDLDSIKELDKSKDENAAGSDGTFEETLQFNEDLLCENHQGLAPDETCRRLIVESAWLRIKQYFPGCPEFPGSTPPCINCQTSIEAENQSRELNKQKAQTEKAALLDLFLDRKRPTNFSKSPTLFVVSTVFMDAWRLFIRDPFRNEPPIMVTNSVLLCIHGGYLFPKDSLKSDPSVTFVTEDEWNTLCLFYPPDCEISVHSVSEEGKTTSEIQTKPPVCEDCLVRKISMEEEEIYEYENETVYVCKHPKAGKGIVITNDSYDSGTDDPEFQGSVKKKGITDKIDESGEPPEKMAKLGENGIKSLRKSQRRRHVRGEKKVTVSSKDTLREFKVQLMRLFSVPPFDQNLYLEGRLLSDNACTLGSLRVAPGSVIDLVADEPQEDPGFLEEMHKQAGIPESGFKGTNLLSA